MCTILYLLLQGNLNLMNEQYFKLCINETELLPLLKITLICLLHEKHPNIEMAETIIKMNET